MPYANDTIVHWAFNALSVGANNSTESGPISGPTPTVVDVHIRVDLSGTTPTLDVKLQCSEDGTNWGDTDPAQQFTQFTGTLSGFRAFKQFVLPYPRYRFVATLAGTTPTAAVRLTSIPR